jgi:hypothetical protein
LLKIGDSTTIVWNIYFFHYQAKYSSSYFSIRSILGHSIFIIKGWFIVIVIFSQQKCVWEILFHYKGEIWLIQSVSNQFIFVFCSLFSMNVSTSDLLYKQPWPIFTLLKLDRSVRQVTKKPTFLRVKSAHFTALKKFFFEWK